MTGRGFLAFLRRERRAWLVPTLIVLLFGAIALGLVEVLYTVGVITGSGPGR